MIFEKSNWTKTDFFLEKTDSLILPLKPYNSGIVKKQDNTEKGNLP